MMNPQLNDFSITLFDHSNIPFCLIRVELDGKGNPEDWTFIYCNKALAALEGVSQEELLGHRFFHIFPDGNRKWLKTYYEAAYENKPGELDEISEEIGVFLHIDVIPAGHTGYCACILKDVKEETIRRKRTNYALTEALMKAEQANASKSSFLSHMSQDISQPAEQILAILKQNRQQSAMTQQENLKKIELLSSQLLHLSDEVMEMSQLESGHLRLAEDNFTLPHFLDDTLSPLRPKLAEKDLHFLTLLDIQHEKVAGDPDRLGQVITNLMHNAIAYTQKGGQIKLSIHELSLLQNNMYCYQFIIEDDGCGMSEIVARQLNLPLSIDVNRPPVLGPTGLGLLVSQRIIRMMGGILEIETEPGEGTSVTITVYLKKQTTAPSSQLLDDLSRMDYSGTEVLLIAKSEMNREIARETLSTLGLSVSLAQNVDEALDILKEKKISLIFDSLPMPEESGHTPVSAIRNLAGYEAAPIIGICSGPIPKEPIPSFTKIISMPLNFFTIKDLIETYVKGKQ